MKLHLAMASLPHKLVTMLRLSFHETPRKEKYNPRYLLMKHFCYWTYHATCKAVKPIITIDNLGLFLIALSFEVCKSKVSQQMWQSISSFNAKTLETKMFKIWFKGHCKASETLLNETTTCLKAFNTSMKAWTSFTNGHVMDPKP